MSRIEDDDTDHPVQATVDMGEEPKRSTAAAALLVLVACNLALAVSKLPPPASAHDEPAARVEPVGYAASVASTVLAAYVASAACRGHGRFSVEAVLAEVQRTWTRPATTALYIELLTTAMASLLLTLRAFLGAASGAATGAMAVSGSVALLGWLGPVLFAHSDIACRMGLIVAAVEEGYEGGAAVERAEALVTGRRARGIAVAAAASAIEQAPAWWCGGGAPAFVVGPAVLAAKLAACYACAAFYYECRKRHENNSSKSTRSKLEGMVKCCGSSMVDETEAEELDCVFECFRLI